MELTDLLASIMSSEEAAHALGVTGRTLMKFKASGALKPIGQFGRRADVYARCDVEEFRAHRERTKNEQ